ncbi:RNA polymerase II-associated protein 1 [[Candida] railenensis]|uniref:RNA polymerase II-associated protein 1 n=1 Tax=[Candida] railenensis TaxID=45579 RepID=A0A9P0QKB1_9ASCO|nr:RNA polymerase II-associated protein 1 [[Candida] railenensis]
MSKPVRQDYIAKVRYINTLPPPPLNPKYLQYNTTEKVSTKEESEQILTSLFRKQNFLSFIENVDEEFGLNLNLINNPGVLNNGDESSIFALSKNGEKLELHPKDKVLLRDAGIGKISKSEPGVSFLRRTEYISEGMAGGSSGSGVTAASAASGSSEASNAQKPDLQYNAESQLKAVETTFDQAQDSLDNFAKLVHPRKKNRKAVAAWPLLPDTSMLDTKFMNIKFSGSASFSKDLEILKRQQRDKFDSKLEKKSIETAIFKPITSADGEWMSLYQCKENKAKVDELKEKLNSTERERPVNLLDEDESVDFKFKHIKNYDMNFQRNDKPYEELAIKLVPDTEGTKKRKLAYYYPIGGRIELKKHRVSQNTEINRFLKDSTSDLINFKLREPNTDEMRIMDNLRSSFDPMEYEAEEDAEQDVEAEVEAEA